MSSRSLWPPVSAKTIDLERLSRMPPPSPVLATLAPMDAEIVGPASSADSVVLAEPAAQSVVEPFDAGPPTITHQPGLLRRIVRIVISATDWLFGAAALIVGLSFLSTYPLFQMLRLGYLLEASGRIARTGRLRDGFVGVRKASRLGSIVFGTWLVLLPLRFVSTMAMSANLIQSDSRAARGWSAALVALTALTVAHIVGACWRGGRLRHFLWPRPVRLFKSLFRKGAYTETRDAVLQFVAGLRLQHY